jgi:hypothetical protein
MRSFGTDSPVPGRGSEPVDEDTPSELIFPPQYPFSWTLRGARSQRLRANRTPTTIRYRISGSAQGADEIAAVRAFSEAHEAKLVLG